MHGTVPCRYAVKPKLKEQYAVKPKLKEQYYGTTVSLYHCTTVPRRYAVKPRLKEQSFGRPGGTGFPSPPPPLRTVRRPPPASALRFSARTIAIAKVALSYRCTTVPPSHRDHCTTVPLYHCRAVTTVPLYHCPAGHRCEDPGADTFDCTHLFLDRLSATFVLTSADSAADSAASRGPHNDAGGTPAGVGGGWFDLEPYAAPGAALTVGPAPDATLTVGSAGHLAWGVKDEGGLRLRARDASARWTYQGAEYVWPEGAWGGAGAALEVEGFTGHVATVRRVIIISTGS
eukprot:1175805-Prorocentrum_minimum.AAC.6